MGNRQATDPEKARKTFQFQDLEVLVNADVRISNQYRVKSPPLGRSSIGELREAFHVALGQKRLLKILYKSQFSLEDLEDIRNEQKMVRRLDHPSVLKVLDYSEDEKYIYIIMEYFKGRELLDRVRQAPMEEAHASRILKELLDVLRYVHSKQIIHRDLNLENILYNGSTIKLMEFGFAVDMRRKKYLTDVVGTPYYIAPEVLAGKYSYSCDVWSFGVIMFFLLTGEPPFQGSYDHQIFEKIVNLEPDFKKVASTHGRKLVEAILQKNPRSRPGWDSIANADFFRTTTAFDGTRIKANFNIIYRKLVSFKFDHKFQLAIYLFVVKQIGNVAMRETIDEIFKLIVSNSRNSVTKSDLRKFCDKYKLDYSAKDIDKLFSAIDMDNTGQIEYYEFLAAASDRSELLTPANIRNIFDYLDKQKTGYLTKKDLQAMFGSGFAEKDVEDFLKMYDQDGNNNLSADEFQTLLTKMI